MGTTVTYTCDDCGNKSESKEGWLNVCCHTGGCYPGIYNPHGQILDLLFCLKCNGSERVKETAKRTLKTFFSKKRT